MNETNDILREFLNSRPKPSDFIAQKPVDDVQEFFNSMASTVRKFTPLAIARIKLKIAQIVGEEEIAWAEEAARVQSIQYLDVYVHPQQPPANLTEQQPANERETQMEQ